MKKLIYLLILLAIVFLGCCTNNEGSEDIDVITPADSTSSVNVAE
jgi:thioredoxin-related protein